jgi:hypothetical protein
VLLHLEFYWPQETLKYCERITYSTTSLDLAIVHARDILENQTFPLGKAKLCLIKNEQGKVLSQLRARRLRA